ncbi:MAG: glycoside hydrolase family 2 TIM barrel-domain containing protein [Bacillota bacterium]|nr:glycoside hydrolase family 2 TIM barrel-domain containing protein [Bacillota bacterium]
MNLLKMLRDTTPSKNQNLKHLSTPWQPSEWKEYPRMQLRRKAYQSLNGIWECEITESKEQPNIFSRSIRVPFGMGSLCSGILDVLQPHQYLWYKTEFSTLFHKKVILHFEAVDQICEVYLNGTLLMKHVGGYTPFEMDITSFLHEKNVLILCVQDFTDTNMYSRGKQRLKREGMWYTPIAGIWQSVWLEEVEKNYIQNIEYQVQTDLSTIHCFIRAKEREKVYIEIQNKIYEGYSNEKIKICIPNPHLWDVEDPYLYDVKITMGKDIVESYVGLRYLSKEKDKDGYYKVFLNHKPIFIHGLLDQGYWSDGILTPPCDQALVYDIQTMKELGFNTLRKHIKIENKRFYYHCDRLGMLVIQDMVNGGSCYNSNIVTVLPTLFPYLWNHFNDTKHDLSCRSPLLQKQWEEECQKNIRMLKNHPSIIAWCIFNEGWGQYDAKRVTRLLRQVDPSRLFDSTSGWFDQRCGDFQSLHIYFRDLFLPKRDDRICILSEYGGYAWNVEGHSALKSAYGYQRYTNKKDLNIGCRELMNQAKNLKEKGLAGLIYTQVSDVEEEVNGILTYDRKIVKIDKDTFRI